MKDSFPRSTIAAVLLAMVAACSSDPVSARQALMAKGDAYFAQRKYAEATIEYRKALQKETLFAEGYYKLAEAQAANGEARLALLSYVRAADLAPDHIDANLKAGTLLLVARRFEDAKARARAVLRTEPNNVRGLILLGNALGGLHDLDDAVAVAEKAAELSPERAGLSGNLGVLEMARGNSPLAEAAFNKAIASDPQSPKPLVALASFYQTLGRFADAEAALKQALQLAPGDLRANQSLATLYLESNRPLEAERYLRKVVEVSQSTEANLALADFFLAAGKLDAALPLLEKVSASENGFAPAAIRKAVMAYTAGRKDEGHALLREVLRREPKNPAALSTEARLLLQEGRFEDAQTLVQQALLLEPHSPHALVTLGKVHLAGKRIEEARKAFSEALIYDPKRVDAEIELARIHLMRREIDTSIRYAERSIQNDPTSLEARLTLVRSLLVRPEDSVRAETELKDLLSRHPYAPGVHSLNAIFRLNANDRVAARKGFERALELNPDYVEALGGLATLDATARRLGDTRTRIESRIAASATPRAELLLLAAKVYAASNDPVNTEKMLRRAIEADPGQLDAYTLLGYFYLSKNRLAEARAEFSRIAERDPRSVGAHTMVGILADAQGDKKGARSAYEFAVQRNPSEAPAAANNLAWIYANGAGSLDVALQLANAARSALPSSPVIADTLGFVYYKRGMPQSALPLLEEAVRREPNNPDFQYHLGLVHVAAGSDAKARVALQQALKLNTKFEGAEDAKRLLSTLVY